MMKIRLFMNGVVPTMLPVSGSRSGAPGGSVKSEDDGQADQEARGGRRATRDLPPQHRPPVRRRASACRWPRRARDPPRSLWVIGPRRGSIRRTVTKVMTTAITSRETMLKYQFAVIVIDWFGSTIAIASFVISVSRASSGAIRMLTAKEALTPA